MIDRQTDSIFEPFKNYLDIYLPEADEIINKFLYVDVILQMRKIPSESFIIWLII